MRTIAITNRKGGCGKTTVAINLSASLAREGRRVLLVDFDPQAHCALGMAVPEEQIDLSILDCLMRQIDGEPLELSRITWQIAPNLDLAPSRPNLATLEPRLASSEDGDCLLKRLLEANADRYDYCLLDCPPHMGLLVRNGLQAASDVAIPVDTGFFSLHGLTQQMAAVEQLGERNSCKPSVRVLANQYDVRTKLAREILAELRKRFEGVLFETIINFNTKLKEGASFGQPITEFAPNSMGARDFQKLARELISSEQPKVATGDILEHVERLAADAERLLATTATLVDREPSPTERETAAPAITIPPIDVLAAATTAGEDHKQTAEVDKDATITSAGKPASDSEIDRKIEVIYGVRQEGEILIFRSRHPDASEVHLAGDFNDWMPHTSPMDRVANGDFETRLQLPKGRYRYRLVIDGRWSHDLYNPAVEENEYGELNSVVDVRQ